jgi:hypothetical protein
MHPGSVVFRTAVPICAVLLFASLVGGSSAVAPEIRVAATLPRDLNASAGGAPAATLEQAAAFGWQAFIALNWPAHPGRRGVPNAPAALGDAGPRVWETLRGRVESYPGTERPFGASPGADYGFDAAPRYRYDPEHTGTPDGTVRACDPSAAAAPPPLHNLDELNQQHVQSGLSPEGTYPGQQILIESKVNRAHYVYVASRGWYGESSMRAARKRTGDFVRSKLQAPPAAARADDPADTEYVSFPNGAMELKAAWRRLGAADDPRQYFRSRVRYYREVSGKPCTIDSSGDAGADVWGLIGFHIMYKTPSAPYFIWATFEHANTIVLGTLGADGRPVAAEDPDGRVSASAIGAAPFTPAIDVAAATPSSPQRIAFGGPEPAADTRLYFVQPPLYDIPGRKVVAVNRRLHPIPDAIAAINRAAQDAIARAAPDSPLRYYRLVAVQWRPLDKPAGQPYTGPLPPAIYYAANVTIEAPPVHQQFSGQFTHGFSKSSDYLNDEMPFMNPRPNPGAPVFFNTFFAGKGFLSGGCMGCHGFRQAYGTDWSFLLERQRVREPEVRGAIEPADRPRH